MRRSRFALLAAALTVAVPAAAEEAPRPVLALGATAPMAEVRMTGVDGRERSIAGVRGEKGTLVVFTCNSCPWVRAWEPRMAELGEAFAKRGIGVIAINPNDPAAKPEDGFEEMKARARERGFTFPYVVDATSEVARAFGATRTPEFFLFDRAGRLVYRGALDDNAKDAGKVKSRWLHDALEAVVRGRPVDVRESKAFGCTIKFRGQGSASS